MSGGNETKTLEQTQEVGSMYHVVLIRGIVTSSGKIPTNLTGEYLASTETKEQAKSYIYSYECGVKLESLGEYKNAMLIIFNEDDMYMRIPVRQSKQIYTLPELRKMSNGKRGM